MSPGYGTLLASMCDDKHRVMSTLEAYLRLYYLSMIDGPLPMLNLKNSLVIKLNSVSRLTVIARSQTLTLNYMVWLSDIASLYPLKFYNSLWV